jgi:gamma-glutamylcyclotransferase (GGCT)/AIG2-like uncharacterized protein YtfP
MFFYGTLTLPHMLQKVLSLDTPPTLIPARISGYEMKLCGRYPALVRVQSTASVNGMAYTILAESQLKRLEGYEGGNYVLEPCTIKLDESDEVLEGWTFVWDGDFELTDGTFDPTLFIDSSPRRRRRT